MYESFYQLREKPFSLLPDPDFLYLGGKYQAALSLLEYGVLNQAGFIVLTGDPGMGKTTLLRKLVELMKGEHTVGLVTNTHRDFGSLLPWILAAFGLPSEDRSAPRMFQELAEFLRHHMLKRRRVLLIVDEAQNLTPGMLEELRLLSNLNAEKTPTLQVVLCGHADLRTLLRQPDLVQFAQRVSVDYQLVPLREQETEEYIRHRLRIAGGSEILFTHAACVAAHRLTGGLPRLINQVCDMALSYGFAEQASTIPARLVVEAVRDREAGGIMPVALAGALPDEPEVSEPASSAHGEQPVGEHRGRPARVHSEDGLPSTSNQAALATVAGHATATQSESKSRMLSALPQASPVLREQDEPASLRSDDGTTQPVAKSISLETAAALFHADHRSPVGATAGFQTPTAFEDVSEAEARTELPQPPKAGVTNQGGRSGDSASTLPPACGGPPKEPASPFRATADPVQDGARHEALYKTGVQLKKAGRFKDAMRALEQAAQHPDYWVKAYAQVAICFREAGRPSDAVAAFRKALSKAGAGATSDLRVRYEFGRTLQVLGLEAEAVEQYRTIVQVSPGYRDVANRLQRLGAPASVRGKNSGVDPILTSGSGGLWMRLSRGFFWRAR